jgi:hypothetical protein
VGIDRPEDGDDQPDSPHRPEEHRLEEHRPEGHRADSEADAPDLPDRATYFAEYKKAVEAEYRAYTIDQGCDRVHETEETVVTPAMRRIESEDPDRHLVGLDFRLKGRERLSEKVAEAMRFKGRSADDAFTEVKDAIRYTFQYPDDRYSDGVKADCERLKEAGFEPVDRKNSWGAEEYKGINSRWRVPGSAQLFEVQFHTQASFEAKQQTHTAYEQLRSRKATDAEREELKAYQRRVSSMILVPIGAADIDDYGPEKRNG